MSDDNTDVATGGGIIGLVLLVLIGWWVYSTWLKPVTWTGFFYYDPENPYPESSWIQGGFASYDECAAWIDSKIPQDFDGSYDYECGSNCKPPQTDLGLYTCKESR